LERILCDVGTVDAILLAGDVTHFGTPDEAETLVQLARRFCPVVFAVAGNCDSQKIDRRLAELDVSLMGIAAVHGGVGFFGVSAMPPWAGGMYELTEERMATALRSGRDQVEDVDRHVVLSHTPPRGSAVDRTRSGKHVGSTAVRELIDQMQPALVVCGHIHEARGTDRIGETAVVNCGPAARGFYAVVDLDEEAKVRLLEA